MLNKLYYYLSMTIIGQFALLGLLDLFRGRYGSLAMNLSLVLLYVSIYILIGKVGLK